jgi:hypothetical protein
MLLVKASSCLLRWTQCRGSVLILNPDQVPGISIWKSTTPQHLEAGRGEEQPVALGLLLRILLETMVVFCHCCHKQTVKRLLVS